MDVLFPPPFSRIWRAIVFEFGISELSIEESRIIILPYNLVLCNLKVIFFWCIRMTKEIEVWEYELCMVCELFSWIRKSYKKLLILIHTHQQNYTKIWMRINKLDFDSHPSTKQHSIQTKIHCLFFNSPSSTKLCGTRIQNHLNLNLTRHPSAKQCGIKT